MTLNYRNSSHVCVISPNSVASSALCACRSGLTWWQGAIGHRYILRQKCSPKNVVFIFDVSFMAIVVKDHHSSIKSVTVRHSPLAIAKFDQ